MPKQEQDQAYLDRVEMWREKGKCEFEAQELARHENDPMPEVCPKCSGELGESGGYAGEVARVADEQASPASQERCSMRATQEEFHAHLKKQHKLVLWDMLKGRHAEKDEEYFQVPASQIIARLLEKYSGEYA